MCTGQRKVDNVTKTKSFTNSSKKVGKRKLLQYLDERAEEILQTLKSALSSFRKDCNSLLILQNTANCRQNTFSQCLCL